mmetsp:Transcript_5370/g.16758  ORF Transcript_5370/g.16758 Transcript_5370/m.16758 type:complete len:322 (-) Transcript_5370:107-1072(-)
MKFLPGSTTGRACTTQACPTLQRWCVRSGRSSGRRMPARSKPPSTGAWTPSQARSSSTLQLMLRVSASTWMGWTPSASPWTCSGSALSSSSTSQRSCFQRWWLPWWLETTQALGASRIVATRPRSCSCRIPFRRQLGWPGGPAGASLGVPPWLQRARSPALRPWRPLHSALASAALAGRLCGQPRRRLSAMLGRWRTRRSSQSAVAACGGTSLWQRPARARSASWKHERWMPIAARHCRGRLCWQSLALQSSSQRGAALTALATPISPVSEAFRSIHARFFSRRTHGVVPCGQHVFCFALMLPHRQHSDAMLGVFSGYRVG